ncbi:hypothetical protein ACPZ19_49520 [Amycolatopsis lurida]
MTIYSQHAHRGKVQILATYRGSAGVVSGTVTSVEDAALAAPIVDALNRISACATVPVSVWDERGGHFRSYPTDHLAALTDPAARRLLIEGAHSLWYEQAMVLLRRALADLDTAAAAVPAPVRTAIGAELAAEAQALRDELAEYTEGIEPPEPEKRRFWEFQSPLVVVDESGLDRRDRENLDNLERELDRAQLARAVADLRLLLDAYLRTANGEAQLFLDGFEISDDPYGEGEDRYFLNVQAPMPDGKWGRTDWNVELCRWVADSETDGDTGETVLECTRSEAPSVEEIVGLLNRSDGRAEVLATWAATAVGDALTGTAFVVTKRHED